MSTRLMKGGRLIDRAKAVGFSFNGKAMRGFAGDTLAAALLANDQMLVGRSFKYHRPRGIVASGAEEPNALVNMGAGGRFEPNQRATTTEVFDGLQAASQNHWPSLEYDIGAVNSLVARFLPGGFYYKTFMYPRAAWKHVFEPFIRQSAGLGKAPKDHDADRYEHAYAFCDVLVAGGGMAGLEAALTAAHAGQRVMLCEQGAHWGGRAVVDGDDAARDWVKDTVQALESMDNVAMRLRCMVAGVMTTAMFWPMKRSPITPPATGGPSIGCGASGSGSLWRRRGRLSGPCPLRAMIFRGSCWPRPCATMWLAMPCRPVTGRWW